MTTESNAIDRAISILEQEISKLQDAVRLLRGSNSNQIVLKDNPEGNNGSISEPKRISDLNIRELFINYLNTVNRFVHFAEVADWINKEHNLNLANITELSTVIGNRLIRLRNAGKLVKIQTSLGNNYTYWGRPEWKETDHKAKPGYEPNPEYPKTNRRVNDLNL